MAVPAPRSWSLSGGGAGGQSALGTWAAAALEVSLHLLDE